MSEQHLGNKMDAFTQTQMKTFEIQNPELFDSPNFENPTQIGYFSLDKHGQFVERQVESSKHGKFVERQVESSKHGQFESSMSKKSLKYFIRPEDPKQVDFDLDKGKMKKKEKEWKFHLLKWIEENMDTFQKQEDSLTNRKVDFVCRRGLLAKIMRTPYVEKEKEEKKEEKEEKKEEKEEKKEDWLIAVQRHNGIYYLHEFETEQQKKAEKNMTEENKKMCCWGWKFEQYITAGTKDGKPEPDKENTCEAFYTVVKAKLGDHFLVFSGEVDAASNDENETYVEFKTSGRNLNRNKLMKWWTQSYIIGVEDIVCGFRDKKGIVHNLEFYRTKELPDKKDGDKDGDKPCDKPWKPNVCLNALDKFLSFIKSSITDDTSKVHTLTWESGQPVQCEPTEDLKYNFLPDGFTNVVK